jgi:hypothetical protein
MKTLIKPLAAVLAAILLCGLPGCGLFGGNKPSDELMSALSSNEDKPPVSSMSGPITGEYFTEGGSKLTFLEDGAEDYWDSGFVLVEFANDAEYLLEGRENNTVYRYVFGLNNLPAPYDVADDFQLSTGDEWFANCHSFYRVWSDVSLRLTPYLLEGDELRFERAIIPGEGKAYDLVPGENGYFDFTKED